VRAKHGGEHTGSNPIERGKTSSKYHLLVDGQGGPLAVLLSAASVHDSKLLEPLVDAVRPTRRQRPPLAAPHLRADLPALPGPCRGRRS
jgi:hypothetical protein